MRLAPTTAFLLCPLTLCALALAEDPAVPKPAEPDPARVEAAVEQLEKAFKKGDAIDKSLAIEENAEVFDEEVATLIAKGLKDKEQGVQLAAIEALRFFQHEEALDALHGTAKRDKKMRKQPELFAALIKAIGQHGNPDSIEILGDDLWSPADHSVIQARILSLGNIRSKESVEELMSMMRKAGWRKVQPFMENFRIALASLTGEDQGKSQPKWTGWWNDAKKTLEVREEAHSLPTGMQRKWDRFWGIEPEKKEGDEPEDEGGDEKKRKRRKRGDD
ncbi:MAG: hypothetical protein CMK00_01475 [Planctomycetes bacterium]|nr:hypothetical protein [Planctomycetota bacterium]